MNTKGLTKWCTIFVLILLPDVLFAQKEHDSEGKKAILKIKHTNDFTVIADTTAASWSTIPWIHLQQRNSSATNYQTKLKLLYSDKGIYALFWCMDRKITATLKEDFADLFTEDVIEIFFWPDEQVPIYFEYELSPLNYELPILVPNMNGKFLGWTPWHYTGDRRTRHVTNIIADGENTLGWVAEFFIPFTLLSPLNNVPPVKGTKWRMNMYRIDYDNALTAWFWQPIRKTFHDTEGFGMLVFD